MQQEWVRAVNGGLQSIYCCVSAEKYKKRVNYGGRLSQLLRTYNVTARPKWTARPRLPEFTNSDLTQVLTTTLPFYFFYGWLWNRTFSFANLTAKEILFWSTYAALWLVQFE